MFSKEILKKAADLGSQEVSFAFSKLSGKNVKVTTSVADIVSYDYITSRLNKSDVQSIITYAQVIEGITGAAILTISREDTLVLVDVLNKKEIGSTGILLDIDRSAVKETLNILSNSYINALTKITNEKMLIGTPHLMPVSHIDEIFKKLKQKTAANNEQMLLFTTALEITEYKINAELHIIFDNDLAQEIKDIK